MYEGYKIIVYDRERSPTTHHSFHIMENALEQNGGNVPHDMSWESQPPSSQPRKIKILLSLDVSTITT